MNESTPTRRDFLTSSALAALGAGASGVHSSVDETIRVGFIGCGGRGTGAASQALRADKDARLVAMGDAFEDRLQSSLAQLKGLADLTDKIAVTPDSCHVGLDAYKKVIDSEVDVVVLTTPPHFRPIHLKYAVERGKHCFTEKPMAVDAPGLRSVIASCEEAKRKGLSVVAGFQLRYSNVNREIIKRVHEGAIGPLVALQANDFRGEIWVQPRQPGWSDMEYQLRNWYYYTWLSGDFNVEQHVHLLDQCLWAMNDEPPAQCTGTGGRQVRTSSDYGHIYDHFSIIYEWKNGTRLFATCRQQDGCKNDISVTLFGAKGTAVLGSSNQRIVTPEGTWRFAGEANNPVQVEHDELFASVRNRAPINNSDYMTKTTMMAIMGRMAGYTGQVITWEMAMNSKEDLSPPSYAWDTPLPEPPVARPGKTKFV